MKTIDLQGTPRPHFVRTGEINISGNKSSFHGEVVFSPGDDVSLVDRDHVNVAHEMFAIWNAAYLAVRKGLLYPKMRVLSQSGSYFAETPLDTSLDLSVNMEIVHRDEKIIKGAISATFVDKDGKTLSMCQMVFLSTK